MRQLTVHKNDENQRLDKYLKKYLKEAPGSFIYKMLRKKNIVLNGKKADGTEKLAAGLFRIKRFSSSNRISRSCLTGNFCFSVFAASPVNFSSVSSAKNSLISSPAANFSVPSAFFPFSTIFFFRSILYIKLPGASLRYFLRYLSKR